MLDDESIDHLLVETKCELLLQSPSTYKGKLPIKIADIVSFTSSMDHTNTEYEVPTLKDVGDVGMDAPVVYIHTSGSTGAAHASLFLFRRDNCACVFRIPKTDWIEEQLLLFVLQNRFLPLYSS